MKIALTILCALVFVFGLFGRVPSSPEKFWKPAWRIYWTLVSVCGIIAIWVELPKTLFWFIVAVSTSSILVCLAFVAGFALVVLLYAFYLYLYAIFAFLCAVFKCVWDWVMDLLFGRRRAKKKIIEYEEVISGRREATEAERVVTRQLLIDLKEKYRIADEPYDKYSPYTGGNENS